MTITSLCFICFVAIFVVATVLSQDAKVLGVSVSKKDMKDKVFLCIGCTRGIGEAAARQMANRGAAVVVSGRNKAAGDAIANDIGGKFLRADMGELDDLRTLFAETEEAYGGIDAVFCNGVYDDGYIGKSIEDISPESIEKMVAVNHAAPVFVYDMAVKAFVKRGGGSLVFTASLAAFINEGLASSMPMGGFTYYSASKIQMTGLARTSAGLMASHNIRVNTVAPAVYKTKLSLDGVSWFGKNWGINSLEAFSSFNPVVQFCPGDPADAAAAAVEMLANTTSWLPGDVVVTDNQYSFASTPLVESFGKHDQGVAEVDVSLLRDLSGNPISVTKEQIAQQSAACMAAMAPPDQEKDL